MTLSVSRPVAGCSGIEWPHVPLCTADRLVQSCDAVTGKSERARKREIEILAKLFVQLTFHITSPHPHLHFLGGEVVISYDMIRVDEMMMMMMMMKMIKMMI